MRRYRQLIAFFDLQHEPPPSDDEEEDGIDVDKLIDSGHLLGDIGRATASD